MRVCICRSVDSPLALLPDSPALEEEVCESQNWQDTVSPQLLAALSQREVDRQAVIYGTCGESAGNTWRDPSQTETFLSSSPPELFTTEVSHLRTLKVLDQVFFQKMRSVLNPEELACIFPNLPQVYELHGQSPSPPFQLRWTENTFAPRDLFISPVCSIKHVVYCINMCSGLLGK